MLNEMLVRVSVRGLGCVPTYRYRSYTYKPIGIGHIPKGIAIGREGQRYKREIKLDN